MDKFVKSQKKFKKHTINRAVAWLLVFLMCFSALPTSSMTVYAADEGTVTGSWSDTGNFADSFAGGKGTEDSPYIIETAAQLARIDKASAFRSAHYKVADGVTRLDMSAHEWKPIRKFTGSFDGNGVTIEGLIINKDAQYIGFFEQLSTGAKVKNINFTNVNIDASVTVDGLVCAGTIAGGVYGATIDNCKVLSGNVKVTRTASNKAIYAGGLIGQIGAGESIITNCFNNSAVEAIIEVGTLVRIGGIFGSKEADGSNAKIINCANTGSVTGTNETSNQSNTLGGIGSYVTKGTITIENCYNAGSVKIGEGANSDGKYSLGGILGANGSEGTRTIQNCYYAEGSFVIPSGVNGTEKVYETTEKATLENIKASSTTLNDNVDDLSNTYPGLLKWKLTTLKLNDNDEDNYPVPVAEARISSTYYSILQEAIEAAEEGNSVTLLDDVAATAVVPIESGVILDLNGYTLDMGNNYLLSDGDVVDNSTDKTGRLKIDTYTEDEVAEGKELSIGTPKAKLAENNSQMPVYIADEGYMLATMTAQAEENIANDLSSFNYISRPSFGATHVGKLQSGASAAGLQFILRLDWGAVTDGVYANNLEFSYSDELVGKIYKNGTVFSVTVNGLADYASSMKVSEYVISDLGVKFENNSFSMTETVSE